MARLGGDEFAIFMSCPGGDAEAAAKAQAILRVFTAPIRLSPGISEVSVSAGFALCPEGGRMLDELLRSADGALYQPKGAGRRQTCLYRRDLGAEVERRHGLLAPGAFQPMPDDPPLSVEIGDVMLRRSLRQMRK